MIISASAEKPPLRKYLPTPGEPNQLQATNICLGCVFKQGPDSRDWGRVWQLPQGWVGRRTGVPVSSLSFHPRWHRCVLPSVPLGDSCGALPAWLPGPLS